MRRALLVERRAYAVAFGLPLNKLDPLSNVYSADAPVRLT
jgi:hypothetical protein